MGTESSRCDIDLAGLGQHPVAEIRAQAARQVKVDTPPQQRRQPLLDPGKHEERDPGPRLEVGQDIDVAGRGEIVAEHGPEEREPPDPVVPAEFCQGFFRDRQLEGVDHTHMLGARGYPLQLDGTRSGTIPPPW